MDDITRWAKTIKEALNRYAKKIPTDVREDFEQECFLKLVKINETIHRIQSEQGDTAAKNYVYGVCINRVKDLVKAERKRTGLFECSEEETTCELTDGEEDLKPLHGITDRELDAAIKQLSREEQHVIRSQFFHGHTWKEMVSSLDKSTGTIWAVRDSALRKLKEILDAKK